MMIVFSRDSYIRTIRTSSPVYVVVQGVGLNFIFFCFGVW